MAGYRITFDGSLNERKNLVQSTGNTSLTLTGPSTISPANWGTTSTPISSLFSQQSNVGAGTVIPAGYYFCTSETVAVNYSGGSPLAAAYAAISPAKEVYFFTSVHNGAINWDVSWGSFNPDSYLSIYKASGARTVGNAQAGTLLFDSFPSSAPNLNGVPFAIAPSTTGSTTLSNEYIMIKHRQNSGSTLNWLYNVYITGAGAVNPVSIFPATNIEGVAPSGGVATAASPSTILDGQGTLASAPKLFGARVVHDSIEVIDAKYLPAADVSEDAQLDARNTKIITATATSLSVEAEGLGGAERLEAGETSLVVEEHLGAVEN